MAKQSPSRKQGKIPPGGASHAAAIRWYALRIEARALELAMTNRGQFNAIRDILRTAKDGLERLPGVERLRAECTPPWDICPDGVCRPDCGDVRGGDLPASSERTTESRRESR